MTPYPRIHYYLPTYAQFVPQDRKFEVTQSVEQLAQACLDKSNSFLSGVSFDDPHKDKEPARFYGCNVNFRGTIGQGEAINAIRGLKKNKTLNFVDWAPNAFKFGTTDNPSHSLEDWAYARQSKSVSLIGNTDAIVPAFRNTVDKFDKLYAKKAFYYTYLGCGLESGEFSEGREDLAALMKDYEYINR